MQRLATTLVHPCRILAGSFGMFSPAALAYNNPTYYPTRQAYLIDLAKSLYHQEDLLQNQF